MTGEQRSAIEDAIAECESRAREATEALLAQKQLARTMRHRAHALRSLLPPATPGEAPDQAP